MRQYHVYNDEGYSETFYNLREAKKAMKAHNAKGEITQIWSNGDWENLGPIRLDRDNRVLIAGTRQTKPGYGS